MSSRILGAKTHWLRSYLAGDAVDGWGSGCVRLEASARHGFAADDVLHCRFSGRCDKIVRMNTAKLLSFLLISLSTAATAYADPRPQALEFSVTGMGYGPSLSLNRGNLYCEVRKSSGARRSKLPPPSSAAWHDFRAALNALKVWRWEEYYSPTSLVYDGTQWRLRIKYAGAAVASDGSNEYPDFEGRPSGSQEPSAAFDSLLAAIRKIAPGCPF